MYAHVVTYVCTTCLRRKRKRVETKGLPPSDLLKREYSGRGKEWLGVERQRVGCGTEGKVWWHGTALQVAWGEGGVLSNIKEGKYVGQC